MARSSYRVRFAGGFGFELAGIVDRPDDVISSTSRCLQSLLHLQQGPQSNRPHLARARRTGIAVLRFDMTGLGGSEGDFSKTSFTTNVADLTAAIEFASVELGPVTALLGHSFGGAASLGRRRIESANESPATSRRDTWPHPATRNTWHLLLARMDPKIETTGVGTVSIGGRDWKIRREMLEDFRTHDLPACDLEGRGCDSSAAFTQ